MPHLTPHAMSSHIPLLSPTPTPKTLCKHHLPLRFPSSPQTPSSLSASYNSEEWTVQRRRPKKPRIIPSSASTPPPRPTAKAHHCSCCGQPGRIDFCGSTPLCQKGVHANTAQPPLHACPPI